MDAVLFTGNLTLPPDELVYVELPAEDSSQVFNEEVWNYVRKGPDRPTLLRIKAKNVNVGEKIYNLDGTIRASRIG